MPLENCPFLKTAYFKSGTVFHVAMVLTQRRRGRRRQNVNLLSAVFLQGLRNVRNLESGIRNAEFATLSNVACWNSIVQFYSFFFVSRSSIRITIIILSSTLQDIEQNVSETVADQGIKEPLSSLAFCCYSNVSLAVT